MNTQVNFDNLVRNAVLSTSINGLSMEEFIRITIHKEHRLNANIIALEAENNDLRKTVESMGRQINLLFSMSKGQNRSASTSNR